ARVEDHLLGFVDGDTTAVFVCPNTNSRRRLIDAMALIVDCGANVLALVEEGDDEVHEVADEVIELPRMPLEELTPIPYIVPLQLLAYYISVERGLNPDKPRNLAKSVTVK
ncbi:MAG: glutamine--fructose-6-phosphate aminotransferase, partial [Thermoprotei archaeon]